MGTLPLFTIGFTGINGVAEKSVSEIARCEPTAPLEGEPAAQRDRCRAECKRGEATHREAVAEQLLKETVEEGKQRRLKEREVPVGELSFIDHPGCV